MTWIIGTPTLFGYALLVSDIRVTWPDKSHLDCLQKIHLVSPSMIGGFSGSVKIGFRMLAQIEHESFKIEQDEDWDLDIIANTWWPRVARRIFNQSEPKEKQSGSSVILAAPDPTKNLGDTSWPQTRIYRFSSPAFEPVKADYENVTSIGDFSSPRVEAIKTLVTDHSFIEGCVLGPKGHGTMLSLAVSEQIEDLPSDLISSVFQFGVVTRGQSEIHNFVLKKANTGVDTPQSIVILPTNLESPFPQIAKNEAEFFQLCSTNDKSATASYC